MVEGGPDRHVEDVVVYGEHRVEELGATGPVPDFVGGQGLVEFYGLVEVLGACEDGFLLAAQQQEGLVQVEDQQEFLISHK